MQSLNIICPLKYIQLEVIEILQNVNKNFMKLEPVILVLILTSKLVYFLSYLLKNILNLK